jgi:L-lactate dehydrogenase complex protein LldG
MSSARDAIFAAISRRLGPRSAAGPVIRAEAAKLIADASSFQPGFGPDNIARFVEKATSERVTATITRVPELSDVPAAVAEYLTQAGLSLSIALQPTGDLTGLDWADIDFHHEPAPDEPICVTLADYGIAETGSIVHRSRAEAPTLFSFLPLHHLVVLRTRNILRYLEDFWAVHAEDNEQPRSINIITGTSGTADIEAKNIRGAHGPRYMRIILIEGQET